MGDYHTDLQCDRIRSCSSLVKALALHSHVPLFNQSEERFTTQLICHIALWNILQLVYWVSNFLTRAHRARIPNVSIYSLGTAMTALTEMQTGHLPDTLVLVTNLCPDDCGLGSIKS